MYNMEEVLGISDWEWENVSVAYSVGLEIVKKQNQNFIKSYVKTDYIFLQ